MTTAPGLFRQPLGRGGWADRTPWTLPEPEQMSVSLRKATANRTKSWLDLVEATFKGPKTGRLAAQLGAGSYW